MARNEQNDYYGKLDEQTLIFRQIDRINRLATYDLEDLGITDWEAFVSRLNMSIRNLEALLNPLIDEKYRERKKKIKERMSDEDDGSRSKSAFLNKDYGILLFNELIALLFRNNVYWGEQENVVVDETKEDEEEAFTLD